MRTGVGGQGGKESLSECVLNLKKKEITGRKTNQAKNKAAPILLLDRKYNPC